MDPAARLCRGHAVGAVASALILQLAVHASSLDDGDHFLQPADAGVAAGHDLDLPALPLGILAVHPKQLTGKKRSLVAARPGADFEDDVLLIVGIFRDEQNLEL